MHSKSRFDLATILFDITVRLAVRLVKFGWLLAAGLTCTVAIFGSYIFVTVQALWWPLLGKADILLPIKIAIVTGYVALLTYVITRIKGSVKSKDIGAILAESVLLALFISSPYALRSNISDFYYRSSFIYLSDAILPWEVRLICTFAIGLPIVFLLTATVSLILMLGERVVAEAFSDYIKAILGAILQKPRVPSVNANSSVPPSQQNLCDGNGTFPSASVGCYFSSAD